MAKHRKPCRKRFSSLGGDGACHFADAQRERFIGMAEVRWRAYPRVCGGFHDHVAPSAEEHSSRVE